MKPFPAILTIFCFICCADAQSGSGGAPAPERANAVSLKALSRSLEDLSKHVRSAVVQVFSTGYTPIEDADTATNAAGLLNPQHSTGSGVIVSADGFILTNAHVVRGARRIQVRVPAAEQENAGRRSILRPEGRLMEAKVVGLDRESDLAVIRVERTGLSYLEFGDSDQVSQGELVMAFGNPLGLEGSVSLGVVSSTSRQIKRDSPMIYIQTDAPINPGNSGGPLVNSEGQLVGINTFILSQSGGSEGLGFAIPANIVKSIYGQIRKEGHVHRGRVGLSAQTITPVMSAGLSLPRDSGVIVSDVEKDGPADAAGMKIGDIILTLNGKRMENARQFDVNLYRYPKGEKVKLEVLRGSETLQVSVPVMEENEDPERFADMVNPQDNLIARLGILGIAIDKNLAAMLPELRNPFGIVVAAGTVSDFTNGTGLKPGDVIYSVNTSPITSVDALRKKLDEFQPGDVAVLQIQRGEQLMYAMVEVQ